MQSYSTCVAKYVSDEFLNEFVMMKRTNELTSFVDSSHI